MQAEATADEAAQEASLEAEAKWEAQVEQLQVILYVGATLWKQRVDATIATAVDTERAVVRSMVEVSTASCGLDVAVFRQSGTVVMPLPATSVKAPATAPTPHFRFDWYTHAFESFNQKSTILPRTSDFCRGTYGVAVRF